jgi:GNAT superfamily N-acetyltransferase
LNCNNNKKIDFSNYVFVSKKSKQILDFDLISQFRNCSYKSGGHLFSDFLRYKNNKCSKIVYCLYDEKVIGWGFRYKYRKRYPIMLYVRKNFRRQGLGSKIYKKLASGLNKTIIEYWPHDKKSHSFFKKVA